MTDSVFTATARFLRGVGAQATVSVAASALAAAVLALPAGIPLPFFGALAQSDTAVAQQERWVSPVASDGKIRERHQDATASEPPLRAAQGLISPAAIVMPMSLDWKQPASEIAVLRQERPAATEPRSHVLQAQAAATAQPSPPRRPVIERAVVAAEAAPLQIAPALQAVALEGGAPSRPPLRVMGVALPTPVARVGDAMSGAVGIVGAAGIWTLSRASSLLPRL
ncbi:MAG TPA: hypothetical protein VGV17_20380 [Bosea sp. (in: a-proteobacteria)]|jgi:hypothetical protein|uniref:hypothetical protein n=1 Tax=Bosea sp. (in: a-proteobacteria) TaxID=1871050 RepID=UPI002DDCCE06|nr:hypothetical protein [Bosea sp. (in: a-proteobacteria)]HEV2556116.1 hypothetical protein [Bosea sp. (in: a-proteobacteria)]